MKLTINLLCVAMLSLCFQIGYSQVNTELTSTRLKFNENLDQKAYLWWTGSDLIVETNDTDDSDIGFDAQADIYFNTNDINRMQLYSTGELSLGEFEILGSNLFNLHGDMALGDGTGAINFYEGITQKAAIAYTGLNLNLENNETNGKINLDAVEVIIGDAHFFSNGDIGIGTAGPSAQFDINHNSDPDDPHIEINESQQQDFARMVFRSSSHADHWTLAGRSGDPNNPNLFNVSYEETGTVADIFTLNGETQRVGINAPSPNFTFTVVHPNGAPTGITGNGLSIKNGGGSEYWTLYTNSTGHLYFYDNTVERARIDESSGNWIPLSDRRAKTNINYLKNPDYLDKILQLRPATYYLKDSKKNRKVYGLMAQEVEKIFPDIVLQPSEGHEYKALSYTELIPILIAGMQEQQTIIEQQKNVLEQQKTNFKQEIAELKSELAGIKQLLENQVEKREATPNQIMGLSSATLQQNQPNPFDQNTSIAYFIPNNIKTAVLVVSNLQGQLIKEIPIVERGQGKVLLEANSLNAGTYQYTLMLDGKVLETKQMILTR